MDAVLLRPQHFATKAPVTRTGQASLLARLAVDAIGRAPFSSTSRSARRGLLVALWRYIASPMLLQSQGASFFSCSSTHLVVRLHFRHLGFQQNTSSGNPSRLPIGMSGICLGSYLLPQRSA